jgi:hypothetical protein
MRSFEAELSKLTQRHRPPMLCWNRKLDCETARAALCCLVLCGLWYAWGFGFRRTGLWARARPRPGALGGALVMPRQNLVRACASSPPKSPGVASGHGIILPGTTYDQYTRHQARGTRHGAHAARRAHGARRTALANGQSDPISNIQYPIANRQSPIANPRGIPDPSQCHVPFAIRAGGAVPCFY